MNPPISKSLLVLRYVIAWPRFLGWLFPLLMCALFAAHELRLTQDGVLAASWRPWFGRRWPFAMCLAAGMIFHEREPNHRTVVHEYVHLRQSEDLAVAGALFAPLLVAVSGSWWLLLMWPGMLLVQAVGYLSALLRGERAYLDAEHERSAYAQADLGAP